MRGVVATGGAGLLVALGVLVVIGRAERHALTPRPSTPASPPTTTTPPAPLAARIRVGRGVAAVAVGQGGVWALRSRSVVRVDPRTLAETTRIPVPACPAALAAERGLVWAIDEPGRRVLRVDAASAHL